MSDRKQPLQQRHREQARSCRGAARDEALQAPDYFVGLTVTGALPDFICSSNGAH
jgi:hypothetical protein